MDLYENVQVKVSEEIFQCNCNSCKLLKVASVEKTCLQILTCLLKTTFFFYTSELTYFIFSQGVLTFPKRYDKVYAFLSQPDNK